MLRKLQDRTLTIWPGRDRNDVSRVLHSDDNTGSEHDLFPSLTDVDEVNTISTAAPDVVPHLKVKVSGPNMNLIIYNAFVFVVSIGGVCY